MRVKANYTVKAGGVHRVPGTETEVFEWRPEYGDPLPLFAKGFISLMEAATLPAGGESQDLGEECGREGEHGEFEAGGLEGVNFASDEAAETAAEMGLHAGDFALFEPTGKNGFTKRDVLSVAERMTE